jgi:hypothetical protein
VGHGGPGQRERVDLGADRDGDALIARGVTAMILGVSCASGGAPPPAAPARPAPASAPPPLARVFEEASPAAASLVERDGTTWTIQRGPSQGDGMYEARDYVLVRQRRGEAAREVARVSQSGFIQTNPNMSGGVDWRFYIATDGAFRAVSGESRTTGIGSGATTEARYAVYRFDGTRLVPADP